MRREDIVRSLKGALLLARFDASGMSYFDLSIDGFWRSFFGAVLIAPMALYWVAIDYPDTEASVVWVLTVETVRYGIGWALLPLVMIPLARVLGLSASYVPFIIAYNWAMVVQSALYFVITVVSQTPVVPETLYVLLTFATFLYTLVYFVFVARVALGVSIFVGTILSLLDFFMSYALILESQRLF